MENRKASANLTLSFDGKTHSIVVEIDDELIRDGKWVCIFQKIKQLGEASGRTMVKKLGLSGDAYQAFRDDIWIEEYERFCKE